MFLKLNDGKIIKKETTACEKPLLTEAFLFLSTFFIQVLSPS